MGATITTLQKFMHIRTKQMHACFIIIPPISDL